MILFDLSLRASQAKHRLRWAKQLTARPKIAVVGGYHYGNLGDMILGNTTRSLLLDSHSLQNEQIALQTIYNINKWPRSHLIVVGGGAVLTNENISKLRERVDDDPKRIAIAGVDILRFNFSASNLDFLSQVCYFSVRSTKEAEKLRSAGVLNVRTMPDIAFAFRSDAPLAARTGRSVGINVVPRLMGDDTVNSTQKMCVSYRNFLRFAAEHCASNDVEVFHIPFTPADDHAARAILRGKNVIFRRYTSNPRRITERMRACTAFIPSRFHSLVVSIILEIPIVPFLYSEKSQRLLEDFFPQCKGITVEDLVTCDGMPEALRHGFQTMTVPRGAVEEATGRVTSEFACLTRALGFRTQS